MCTFIADTHTHTHACTHAYSTLTENANAAAQKGLLYLCHTEHSEKFPGGPDELFFLNFKVIPSEMFGVKILHGIEVDIMNLDGEISTNESVCGKLQWVIASMHELIIKAGSKAQNTECFLELCKKPFIHTFGHLDNANYPIDFEKVISEMGKYNKVVEINNNSINVRPGSWQNALEMLRCCKKYDVSVVASSDAHFHTGVGSFEKARKILIEADFPDEMVINADTKRWEEFVFNPY